MVMQICSVTNGIATTPILSGNREVDRSLWNLSLLLREIAENCNGNNVVGAKTASITDQAINSMSTSI